MALSNPEKRGKANDALNLGPTTENINAGPGFGSQCAAGVRPKQARSPPATEPYD